MLGQSLCALLFTGICTKVICTMKTAIILIEILLFAMFLGLFFVLAFYHDSHLKQSGYPGDTILLVEGLEPFWYQGIVVKAGGSTQTEWEVSLFKEKCTDLKSYYTESHVESRNLTSNGEPVRILEHRSNLNNYFTSGNISVTVLISSTTRVEMDLCIFDNLQWYQDFYENPTKEAKQKSWKPCMHNYTDVQPTTLTVSYLIDSPSYYFIAVAPTKPVSFSLQYTLQLQQEVYNHSDYEPLNCTVTSTSFCSVPLTGEYALGSGDEWCILAFDPVLPSDNEDYIPLQVHLKSRALNTFSICVLGVLLIFVIIACTVKSGICLYVKIKQISDCK